MRLLDNLSQNFDENSGLSGRKRLRFKRCSLFQANNESKNESYHFPQMSGMLRKGTVELLAPPRRC